MIQTIVATGSQYSLVGPTMTPVTITGTWQFIYHNPESKISYLQGSGGTAIEQILQGKSGAATDRYAITNPASFGGITQDNTPYGGPNVINGAYPSTTTSPAQNNPVITHIYPTPGFALGSMEIFKVDTVISGSKIAVNDPGNKAAAAFAIASQALGVSKFLPLWTRIEIHIGAGAAPVVLKTTQGDDVELQAGVHTFIDVYNGVEPMLVDPPADISIILSYNPPD